MHPYQQNQLNQASIAPPKAIREDAASSTLDRIESQLSQLADLCARAAHIANALNGQEPSPPSAGQAIQAAGRPPYLVGSLAYINAQFGDRLGELQSSLSRIESALG